MLNKGEENNAFNFGRLNEIHSLLWKTDSHKHGEYYLHLWPKKRELILGRPPKSSLDDSPGKEFLNARTEAWWFAPSLSELLGTVASNARGFKRTCPEFMGTGRLIAAISSQKKKPKTEYIRVLAYLLTEECGLELTHEVRAAMAITATVVINAPDIVVTNEDVRKAAMKLT